LIAEITVAYFIGNIKAASLTDETAGIHFAVDAAFSRLLAVTLPSILFQDGVRRQNSSL
jgi:hypothetical protein